MGEDRTETETPIAPPSERKKETVAVAAPAAGRDGVLHRQHQVLRGAQADADQRHVDGDQHEAGVRSIACRAAEAGGGADRADDQERFQRPVLETRRPTTREESASPRIIGMVRSPALVGVAPREIWKYWARKTVAPYIATPMNRPATWPGRPCGDGTAAAG